MEAHGNWLKNQISLSLHFKIDIFLQIFTVRDVFDRKEKKMAALSKVLEMFALPGEINILEEPHFGIFNGRITTGINFKDVLSVAGLWAPPYASSDFRLEPLLFDEKIPTHDYKWYPFEVRRTGTLRGITVTSTTILPAGSRAVLIAIVLCNTGSESVNVPVKFNLAGGLDYVKEWGFSKPPADKHPAVQTSAEPKLLIRQNRAGVVIVGTDISGLVWDDAGSCWHGQVTLSAGASRNLHLAVAIGEKSAAEKTCRKIIAAPERVIAAARRDFEEQVKDMFAKLPSLKADDERLVNIYNRSILHFLLHKWQVPEFVLQPYYGTGSINGGCIGNYLWNFGEGWEIHPLSDPKAMREHIKQFLQIDLTKHKNFNPMDGQGMDVCYHVNQEKIIGLAYYYVLNTGDVSFLSDTVGGKTILEHMIDQALVGDDLSKPVALYDYGMAGETHLELRRGIPYHGIMPDLNGRRYLNYTWAYALSGLAGRPDGRLPERAAALKPLLKKELWNREKRWFDFMIDGKKDIRWTIQMFKLINSPVLDEEEEIGLLSHLNEREFVSEFGLHSLAKGDPAYDQADVDNGGPGACTCFPPQVIERLYKAGHIKLAEDLFRRILWWGGKMPYWGDSIVADKIDYRRDTPLQCTIDGITVAQTIIFGMLGVNVQPDGDIIINPHPPAYSPKMRLTGLKLRGFNIDLSTGAKKYRVKVGRQTISSAIGVPVVIDAQTGKLIGGN